MVEAAIFGRDRKAGCCSGAGQSSAARLRPIPNTDRFESFYWNTAHEIVENDPILPGCITSFSIVHERQKVRTALGADGSFRSPRPFRETNPFGETNPFHGGRNHRSIAEIAQARDSIRGKTIAVLGLTFKPNTDDTRDSPAIPPIVALNDLGANVQAYDPAGMEQLKPQLPSVTYCNSAYSASQGAEAAVIATEWSSSGRSILPGLKARWRSWSSSTCEIYRPDEMKRATFRYVAIGRRSE